MISSNPTTPFAPLASIPPPPEVGDPDRRRLGAVMVLGRTLAIGVVAGLLACLLGGAAGVVAFLAASADGDPGDWDGLGSVIFGFLAFVGVGGVVWLTAMVKGIRRYIPKGERLLAALFTLGLLSVPAVLAFVGEVLASTSLN